MKQKTGSFLVGGIIAGIIIVAGGAFLIFHHVKKSSQPAVSSRPQIKAPEVVTSSVDKKRLPADFPADFPVEKGAVVYLNTQSAIAGGLQHQSTRQYASAKTIDENFTLFKNYFTGDGWTVVTSSDQPTVKIISAKNGSDTADVTISKNATNGTVVVNFVVTY